MSDRQLPHHDESERALLGSLLIDRDAIAQVVDWLKPEAFYDLRHERIYRSMLWLWNKRTPCDYVTLCDALVNVDRLDKVGGADYLSGLMVDVPFAVHVVFYAETVMRRARQRAMIDAASRIVAEAYADDLGADDAALMLRSAVEPLAGPDEIVGSEADQVAALRSKVELRWAGELHETVVSTGIRMLDRMLAGGLRGGEMFVLAARPSIGKSALMLHMASGARAMVFSLEMHSDVCRNRLISTHAGVPYSVAMLPIGDIEMQNRWLEASAEVETWPLSIHHTARTTTAIEAMVLRAKAETGVDIVFIDHMGWLQDTPRDKASEYDKMSYRSRRCKELAMRCDVPVVALSQLNREVEHRPGCLPYMSDLRESGKIEEDADHVVLMYRRAYYSARGMGGLKPDMDDYITGRPAWDRLNLNVVKNRNGAVGSVDLGFEGHCMRIHEVEERLAA